MRWAGMCVLGCVLAARLASADSPIVELDAQVLEFNDRVAYFTAGHQRYQVERKAIPEEIDLRPGRRVDFNVELDAIRIVPLKSELKYKYQAPRKRDT